MLLAVDIGNTNIVLGAYEGETLVASWRTATAVHRMPDEYAMLLNSFFTYRGLKLTDVDPPWWSLALCRRCRRPSRSCASGT